MTWIDLLGLTATCPPTPPCPNDPNWRPYPHSTVYFHCGFWTVLENRPATPNDPVAECVYDKGHLVDDNHPYYGCKGTRINMKPAMG